MQEKHEIRPERPKRPKVLDCDVIRFNINEEKWVAFVGLKESRPYEIFTGIADEEIFPIPKSIVKGKIIKIKDEDGKTRYDFQYTDKYGYKKNMGGLVPYVQTGILELCKTDFRSTET